MQYWVGAFNGKGYALANTTNQPEVIGRLRFYPWRKTKSTWFKQFAFGGSVDFARIARAFRRSKLQRHAARWRLQLLSAVRH